MAESFLTINGTPLATDRVLNYLQLSGKLRSFLGEVLRQYVLEEELQVRNNFDISPSQIDRHITEFRSKNQLVLDEAFQAWLEQQDLDFTAFYNRVSIALKVEKLKVQVAEPKLIEYFIENKIFLDRLVLSRITTNSQPLVEELKEQILEKQLTFEQSAQEYSLTEEKIFNGMLGIVSRGSLPDALRAAIDRAKPGDLIGPVEIEKYWCLFRVEKFLPISLDGELKQELIDAIFEQWLAQKIEQKTIDIKIYV